MSDEKKELQNEDVENVSGGQFSLEKAKKFASKHKKALIGAGVAAAAAASAVAVEEGVFKGKHRKALFGQEDISVPENARYGPTSPNAGKPLLQSKEDVARAISPQNEDNFYDESENEGL